LKCFTAVVEAGCTHTAIITGPERRPPRRRLSNGSTPRSATSRPRWLETYRAVRENNVPRYLAELEYRFNRRYDLGEMIPRLAFVAIRTLPCLIRC